jgi:arylsulfatase A-like enzyme
MNKQPNIVYILADDWGYGDVSCLNPESRIPTPCTDAVAAAGMTFTDAHSNSAVCTPTRYGILTGRYAWRSPLKSGVLWGESPSLIENDRTTVASFLRGHGYHTACIGKWHLGLGWSRLPGREGVDGLDFTQPLSSGPHTLGFDESYIIPASLDMAPYCYIHNGRIIEAPTAIATDSARPAFWRSGPISPGFQHETCLLEFTRRAEAYIDHHAHHPQPFFLYFATPSPHTPHVPRAPFHGRSGAGVYGDFVCEHDWSIGRILAALERHGLTENTLVIVTSDNGAHSEPLRLEEQFGHRSNHLYRGQKSDAWDGGHRIPFIARWPGVIPAGARCERTICLTDLLATCADIVGDALPRSSGEDSESILPRLRDPHAPPRSAAVVHHSMDGEFAIRRGGWKLVTCRGSGGWTLPDAKVPADAPAGQLYNMQADPAEQHNLYTQRPDLVAELQQLLDTYRAGPGSVDRSA